MQHRAANLRTILAGLVSLVIVLAPQAGDELTLELHTVGHHSLHIGLLLAAFVVFASLVGREVRRNGWPVFSWSL